MNTSKIVFNSLTNEGTNEILTLVQMRIRGASVYRHLIMERQDEIAQLYAKLVNVLQDNKP